MFVSRFLDPTLRKEREGWGTRRLVAPSAEDRFMSRGSATPVTPEKKQSLSASNYRLWLRTGAPRSPQRTWAEYDGAKPPQSLSLWLAEETVPVHASSDEQSSESIRNNSFSAQIRWGEPGAPVLVLSDCPFHVPWVSNAGDNRKESRMKFGGSIKLHRESGSGAPALVAGEDPIPPALCISAKIALAADPGSAARVIGRPTTR
jgi:hypothetical protein